MKHISPHQVMDKLYLKYRVMLFATLNAVLLPFQNNIDAVLF